MEQEFWERFGARLSPAQLEDWPEAKVRMYWTIIDVIHQLESEQQQSKSGGGGSPAATGMAPADATQLAFEQMVKEKQVRPET